MRSIDSAELDQSVTKRSLSDGQVAYLNIIRALAAELVLVSHAFLYFHADSKAYMNAKQILGTLGVVLFFLISGFLISRSAFTNTRRGSYTLSDYIIERFARIYTAFLPALVSIAVLDYFLLGYPAFPDTASYNYSTFFGNLFMVRGVSGA
jgi:peptidoglycan/LPS O-acetylase OafA/YrhL